MFTLILSYLYSFNVEKLPEFSLTDSYGSNRPNMVIKENILYSINSRSLQIFDFTNNEFNLVTDFNLEGSLVTLSVSENYAYVATGAITCRLYRIDITDILNPTITDTITYLGNYVHFVDNSKVFVNELHDDWSWTIHVYDDDTFTEITEFQVPQSTHAMKFVSNGIASVKTQTHIYLYDITDINNVILMNTSIIECYADCKPTLIENSILLINCYSGLIIYDISIPDNWITLHEFNEPNLLDYVIMGNKLILIYYNSIIMYDITNISNPVILDVQFLNPYEDFSLSITGLNDLFIVKTEQGKLINFDSSNNIIELVDIHNNVGKISSMYYYNNNVYIASFLCGIQQFNIPDLNQPILTNQYYSNYAAFWSNGKEDIFVTSFLDPITPLYFNKILQIENSGELNELCTFNNITQNPMNIYYCEDIGYFYVNSSILYKYMMNEYNELIEVASLQLPNTYEGGFIYFHNDIAYIQCLDKLAIVDQIDTSNMNLANELNTNFCYEELHFYQDYLFITSPLPEQHCSIYTLSNPLAPYFVLNISHSGLIAIDEQNELMFMGSIECEVYDLSDIEYGIVDQVGSFRNWSNCVEITPFQRENENYLLYLEDTSCSIYHYEYDPNGINDEIISISPNLSNHPNPFNPSTEIRFNLSDFKKIDKAEISIYNIKGQKVKSLDCHPEFSEGSVQMNSDPRPSTQLSMTQAGNNQSSVTWDGNDKRNQPVGSGVYFYQLEVNGETVASRKCLLLK